MESGCWTQGVFHHLGWAREPMSTQDDKGNGLCLTVAGCWLRVQQSHYFRDSDAQPSQRADQRALCNRGGGQQKLPARGVFFGEDVVTVIEIVEHLGQLKSMPG